MKNNTLEEVLPIKCFFLESVGTSTKLQDVVKIFSCVFTSLLIVPTILLNGLVIATIWKTSSLHTPNNVLLLCLACADFVNGLISEPFSVIHLSGEVARNSRLFCIPGVIMESAAWFASGISGATVLALGVDRFLAVHISLRYNEIVTVSRTLIFVAILWPVFTINIFARLIGAPDDPFLAANVVGILFTLFATMLFYYKILKISGHHRVQIEAQVSSVLQLNQFPTRSILELKARKSLITAMYIVGIFWLCYFPFTCVLVSRLILGVVTPSLRTAYALTAAVVYANSALNPGLYCWRIKAIRREFLKYVRTAKYDVSEVRRS